MTGDFLDFPAFWGTIGESAIAVSPSVSDAKTGSRLVWRSGACRASVWIRGENACKIGSWNSSPRAEDEPAIFVWGQPRIASDAEFAKETRVNSPSLAELPEVIAQLYKRHGTASFELLEGNFALLLADAQNQRMYLAVDKFGCEDIYYRAVHGGIAFASHPGLFVGDELKYEPLATAFFLAQEGFVPAPFTLFDGINTVGRARYLRISKTGAANSAEIERYWRPSQTWNLRSRRDAVEAFYPLLEDVVGAQLQRQSGLLLSGGVDSSLLLDIAARRRTCDLITITGSVEGYHAGEQELARSQKLSQALQVPHEQIVIDPQDESLPEDWRLCTESWMNGARTTVLLFHRLAARLRERLGEGYCVLSGQLADTLADNNYTEPSLGYLLRRAFYSPWFLSLLPLISALNPSQDGWISRQLICSANLLGGLRIGGMLASALDGLKDRERFYAGRLFGYGEMPGRSHAYFPMLTRKGFERVADWYSSNFISPIVSRMEPSSFYQIMFDLSMDMVMLHLDTRLVFHIFRLARGKAELPFLDARVVNFFASLPHSARAIYRAPKDVIRAQFSARKLIQPRQGACRPDVAKRNKNKLPGELLLGGPLGAYMRELIRNLTALDCVPGIFELLDERYYFHQLQLFKQGSPVADAKFISRVAALELWTRCLCKRPVLKLTYATV